MHTRREVVRSALAVALLPSRRAAAAEAAVDPINVDIHCHAFNAHDIPAAGFIECYLIGKGFPEVIVHLIEQTLHEVEGGLRLSAPSVAGELEDVNALIGGSSVTLASAPLSDGLRPTATKLIRAAATRARSAALGLEAGSASPSEDGSASFERFMAQESLDDVEVVAAFLSKTNNTDVRTYLRDVPGYRPLASRSISSSPLVDDERRLARYWAGEAPERWVLKIFGDLVDWIGKLWNFVTSLAKSRVALIQELARASPHVTLFTPALIDFDLLAQGERAPCSMADQVKLHGKVSRLHAIQPLPGTSRRIAIHGIVPYNPFLEAKHPRYATLPQPPDGRCNSTTWVPLAQFKRWDEEPPTLPFPFDTVRRAVEQESFVAVKLYPPSGYRVCGNLDHRVDHALFRLYRWCEEAQVPIMTHSGQSNLFSPKFKDYPQPSSWRPILQRFPRLRVCMAHFGGEGWLVDAADLAGQFPGRVWFDIADANVPLDAARRRQLVNALGGPGKLYTQLLYGTDFFMHRLHADPADYVQLMSAEVGRDGGLGDLSPDFASRYFGENALRFLGLRDDTGARVPETTVGNRRRLLQWYRQNSAQPPRWL